MFVNFPLFFYLTCFSFQRKKSGGHIVQGVIMLVYFLLFLTMNLHIENLRKTTDLFTVLCITIFLLLKRSYLMGAL